MVLKIYAVYDSVAGSYGLPFFCENDGVALRSFSALSLDPSSYVSKFPKDYLLFCLGVYDDDSGKIVQSEIYPVKPVSESAVIIDDQVQ